METTNILTAPTPLRRGNIRIATLLALVALADVLIFGHAPGINLFLFAMAVSAGILLSTGRRISLRARTFLLGFSAIASAPLLEAASPMGILLGLGAILSVALVRAHHVPARLSGFPLVLCRFALAVPLRLAEDGRKYLGGQAGRSSFAEACRSLGVWLLPLSLAAVFLFLFAAANPLIDVALRSIDFAFLLQFLDLRRIGFWLVVAAFVWAMLRPRLRRRAVIWRARTAAPPQTALLGEASLLRCLILFNALFAVQTLLDLVYLWGGADLPDHMSHAEYAHRGAYPLIATALLAAAFVLLTMRRDGPGDKSRLIRGLVHAWIGQNILLCLSSMLRLDLYVAAYSLTELRVAAGIWMGLVAIGLALILLRILLGRSNQWLIAMNLASMTLVLYLTAVFDIPGFIARFNVTHSQEIAHDGMPLDLSYLASLGPSAIPALDLYLFTLPDHLTDKMREAQAVRDCLADEVRLQPDDWRSWTFRSARLAAYLRAPATIAR